MDRTGQRLVTVQVTARPRQSRYADGTMRAPEQRRSRRQAEAAETKGG